MNYPLFITPHSSVITALSPESVSLQQNRANAQSPGSSAWPSANLAIYIPFSLKMPVTVSKMFTANGATAAGNFDIGIFTLAGTKILSTGSTAQSGTSVIQVVSVTQTTIGAGMYYLGMSSSSAAATYQRYTGVINNLIIIGILNQATAFALPATATFAIATQVYVPIFGFSTTPNL